jgi:phospholipase/carboxylesterase
MSIPDVFYQGPLLTKAKGALILLHGRGATAQSMLPLADLLCNRTIYVAAPQAPHHTWYPYPFMVKEELNEPFLSQSITRVYSLVEETARYIPKEKIVLLGFSQGACLALETAARHAALFKGIAAFTGGLIGEKLNEDKYKGDFAGTPIFIGNSDHDAHVPLSRSEESKRLLENQNARVTLEVYPGMQHTINQEEIKWVHEHFFND